MRVPGIVTSLEPLLVLLEGIDDEARPCDQEGHAEKGMRGAVDTSNNRRVWLGQFGAEGVPSEIRHQLADLSNRFVGVAEVSNSLSTGLSEVEVSLGEAAVIIAQARAESAAAFAAASAAGIEIEEVRDDALDAWNRATQGINDAATASKMIAIGAANPTVGDGTGRPVNALWEVRSGTTVLRRWIWSGTAWSQITLGQDFIGSNAIGSAQVIDASIGTAEIADLAVTNAKVGSIEVGKLTAIAGDFTTAVVDKFFANTAFLTNAVAKKLIIQGQNNKVGSILLEDGAVTTPKLFAGSITGDKLAILSTDSGLYIDPNFLDSGLLDKRASNMPGMTAGAGKLTGTGNPWLTQHGADEGLSIPCVVGDTYTIRVWGTGLISANGRKFALKDDGRHVTLDAQYFTGGMSITFVATATNTRVQVYRSGGGGTATMEITRVEFRHGIGGTLIEGGAISAEHMNINSVFANLKITSPTLETNLAADRGIKIIDDTLTGYSPTGEKLIDLGGPNGLIKGVTLEGVSVNGGSFKTNAGTDGYVDIRSYGASHEVKAVGTAGRMAFSLSGVTGPEEYGIMQLYSTTQGRELYATAYMLAFRDNNGTGQNTLEILNNALGPLIHSRKEPLSLTSDHGVYINGVEVAGREVSVISSVMTLVRQGRTRELYLDQTGTFGTGNTTAYGTVPAADRPTLGDARGFAYLSGDGFGVGGMAVGVSGLVNVTNPGTARTRSRAHATWTV